MSKRFYYSSAPVATCIWEVAKSFTATDVHNLIIEHHYDRYKYDGNASACLFWTKAIIKMLEQEGYIKAGATEELEKKAAETQMRADLWVPNDQSTFF
ncbi:hypothetical protein EW146_g6299 [Bondarzewia mesenterica]|uniref:DUF7770 domain-containing protein n=1 Tax=Bondarzewia mesenterica TaxID=1095465 RepID=A0A4S4LP00_9AGAM|nr:hypothetical protein EW146_g6299 [Bondarzewia mesenterica]